ncbi:MAG TPA: hypothetical protein VGF39_07890 [Stellaceae bacterium]|jgi:hypothetical protein
MADFDTSRSALNYARAQVTQAEAALFTARQHRAKLQAQRARLARTGGEGLARLDAAVAQANENEMRLAVDATARKRAAGALAGEFATVADPRKEIERWRDDNPVLLLPVRLEARFKTVSDQAGAREELWVRIYPDDCSVDTFEAALSDTEIDSGRRFWIETWAAGGIEAQRRAAWRNLVAGHGGGRAAWIVHEYTPAVAAPVKASADDIVLVIAAYAPPSAAEQTALAIYWRAAWLAMGDAAAMDAALQALTATPGVGNSDQLVAQFVPANLAAAPPAAKPRSAVAVQVAWLTLPALAAGKTRSWSAPARVRVLPDRFVVQGWQNDRMVFEQVGAPIPDALVAGPDPAAPITEQMRHDAAGELAMPDDILWMTDFDTAVAVGMGVRIALDPQQVDLARPLQRVFALGVRLAEDAAQGQARLEELLQHHRYGRAGFGLLPQGAPTKNMEEQGAAYSRYDDADALLDSVFGAAAALDPARDWWRRQDGQWLADALGVAPAAFDRLPHAADTDMAEARAMNRALWPGTFGYAMQTMLHPICDDAAIETTRWFQTHFVSGRGMLPALRIGNQPYGVLPISALSQAKWLYAERTQPVGGLAMPAGFYNFRRHFAAVLAAMRQDWQGFAEGVSHIGSAGDAHQILLDIIGLHPASVEFHQRYAEGLDHLFNAAKLQGIAGQILELIRVRQLQEPALALLRRLGYVGEIEPDAMEKFFTSRSNRLNGPLIDDRPLSEIDPVRAYTADNRNYLAWLADAARASFEDLRQERGFNSHAPDALLYTMLHHALMLGYWDSSLRLFIAADVMTPASLKTARRESSFMHVSGAAAESESRYAPLYSQDVRVADNAGTVANKVRLSLAQPAAQGLADQLAALDLLKDIPTARLERCLAEHIDIASFRLDAWLLGLVNYQLAALRYPVPTQGQPVVARQGVYLGAYGWLENLHRKSAELQPVTLEGDLATAFPANPAAPLMRDPANGGFVLAPSINHATTASILRAGYLANASAAQPDALSVNLSSARVRVALGLIEGIRNGQPLGTLLGYRLQRGLHDGHPGLELDRFIAPMRKQFPLVADQLASTLSPEGTAIEAIEANNVIDGLKLIERIRTSGHRAYPFGLGAALPSVDNSDEQDAIDFEVNALLDAHDATADLALAEGVHQAVLGNFDRVASTLDAYAKGTFPPEPEVARTPRSGLGLTHRVGLHFETGVDVDMSPLAGITVNPRSRAQPMVNKWLAHMLPAPDQVGVQVQWTDPSAVGPQDDVITQKDLGLQSIDLLYIVVLDADQGLSELDDRILRELQARHAPRPDSAIVIRHTTRLTAPMVSFFEIAPLIRHLRSLLLRSRPLVPTDLALAGEASRRHDAAQIIDRARVQKTWDALDTLHQDLAAAAIAAPVDTALADAVALFERAAKFGIQQVGWGFGYEWRRRTYADLLGRVATVVTRWDERLAKFDADLVLYDALLATTSDEERYTALSRLDLLIAAGPLSPRPATPLAYRNQLPARRAAFVARRTTLAALTAAPDPSLAQLFADIQALPSIADFDLQPIALVDVADAIALFVADLQKRVTNLKIEAQRRLDGGDAQLQRHDASADAGVRLRALQEAGSALLGSDMKLIGEFTLPADQAAELDAALTLSTGGALTQYLRVTAKRAFPVEDWLHGVARVREKIHAWEQTGILAPTLGGPDADLTPAQLPCLAGEGWLAMEFDPATAIEGERLLYTAHYATAPDPTAAMCGMLIDEWTEVVPARDETIGLSFNYHRPGSEPPQAWLLVTPAQMDGAWQWSDLVGALTETLDLARLRAVEPAQVDATPYARFLPATTSAATLYGISIGMNLSRVNQFTKDISGERDG